MKKMRKKQGTVIPGRLSTSETLKLSRALADLAFEHKLDKTIESIQDSYLSTDTLSIEDLSHKILSEAKRLTGSAFGFAGYIDPGTGWFIAVTLTRDIWHNCRIKNKSVVFKEFTGLWGWVLKNKKPLLTNDAQADRRSSGVPNGHIKIEKFLAAPAVCNRRLAGILTLANPGRDYSSRDLAAVRKLAHIYAIILQRKFAEDRLKAGEEQLRSVVDNSRDIIYSIGPDGTLTYISRQVNRYGYDPEKIVGRNVLEFAHPDDRPRLHDAIANAIRTGKTLPLLAYRLKKKDGSYFFAEQKSGVIIKNGRPHSISGVIRDVTDSRQLEKQILESEKKYRTLFDQAVDGIVMMPLGGEELFVNDSFAAMHGYDSPKEMARLRLMDLDTPGTARLAPERLRRLAAGEAMSFDVEHYRKDGTVLPLQVYCKMVDIDGQKHFLGFHRDMTAAKQAEEALSASERMYRLLAESLPDYVYLLDPRGRLLYSNRPLPGMPDQVAGKAQHDLFPPKTAKKHLEVIARVASTGESSLRYESVPWTDGGTVWFENRLVPLKDPAGRVTKLLGITRDVTERKKLEAEILTSGEKYRALFENANAAIFLADAETGIIVDANRRAELLTGRARNELIGMDRLLLHPESEKEHYKKHFTGHVRKGSVDLDEAEIVRKDGTAVPVQISASLLDLAGKKVIIGIFEDVTERRKLEEAMRAGERKFRALFDHTSQFIGMLTPNGRLMEANQTALDFAGITRDDCIGKFFWDTSWWRHSAEMRKKLRQAVETTANGGTVRFEATHIASDGSLHYVEFSLKPVTGADGRVLFLIPEGRDITERRRLLEELRESRERFKGLVETTRDWVWETDRSGAYTYSSPQVERILGYKPEKLIGKTPFDLMPPEEAKRVRKFFEQRAAAGEPFSSLENLNLHSSGREVMLETNAAPFHGPDGRLLGYRGIDRDITERRRIEAALRQNEATLLNIFDTAPDMIFFKGLDGRYIKVNKACAAVFQMTPEELAGKSDGDIFPAGAAETLAAVDKEIIRTGRTMTIDDSRVIAGKEYYFSTIKAPLKDVAGKTVGILGIVRDVTEQKRTEGELINAKAVAKAGKITGDAAHDFNNILSTINGYAAIILDELNDKSPIKPDILEIVKAVRRATTLTEKLQALGKDPDKKA